MVSNEKKNCREQLNVHNPWARKKFRKKNNKNKNILKFAPLPLKPVKIPYNFYFPKHNPEQKKTTRTTHIHIREKKKKKTHQLTNEQTQKKKNVTG